MTLHASTRATCDTHAAPVVDHLDDHGASASGRPWYEVKVADTRKPHEFHTLTVCHECYRRLTRGKT